MGNSWQRVPNTPYVMKIPRIAYSTFLKFCPTPFYCCLQTSPPLLFLMPCFFDWMDDWATLDVLFHLMISWIYKCWALVPFTRTILLCISHTYTKRYTAHSGTNRLPHPYKHILTSPAMGSQQLSVLHWITHWYPKFTFHNLFSFQRLVTCWSCLSVH